MAQQGYASAPARSRARLSLEHGTRALEGNGDLVDGIDVGCSAEIDFLFRHKKKKARTETTGTEEETTTLNRTFARAVDRVSFTALIIVSSKPECTSFSERRYDTR